ncbi:MAG: DNA translocase FtsK 4TM domain-containing protein [Phycisphaerales bacterium]|nr:DNA translocase FtsK 4TM domain-containing protein [Phycisphaerales bacterium]
MADSRKSSRGGRSRSSADTVGLGRRLLLISLLLAWAFVAASLIGFNRADPPTHVVWPANDPVANWCGPFGASTAYVLYRLLGYAAWVIVILVGLGLLSTAMGGKVRHAAVRLIGAVMMTIAAAGLQNLMAPLSGPLPDLAGGTTGVVTAAELGDRFGTLGSFLWLALMGILGSVVAIDEIVSALTGWTMRFARERAVPAAVTAGRFTGEIAGEAAIAASKSAARTGGGIFGALAGLLRRESKPKVRSNDIDDDTTIPEGDTLKSKRKRKGKEDLAPAEAEALDAESVEGVGVVTELKPKGKKGKGDEVRADAGAIEGDESANDADAEDAEVEKPARKSGKKAGVEKVAAADEDDDQSDDDAESPVDEEDDEDAAGAPQVYSEDALREKIAKLPILFGQKDKKLATAEDLKGVQSADDPTLASVPAAVEPSRPYEFPSLDLLEVPEENFNAKLEEYVRDQATALESALRQYRIDGEVVGIESGPVITLYDVRLAPGTKVAAISAVSSDIARALKAINIRIVPNQVGRDTVGIEVPNTQKEKVRLRELMGKSETFAGMKLPMFLGKDASGEVLIEDLTKMPHMLIAGTTGSGKSVCMNTIIMSFLYTKKPSELKLVLVDPKMVEMSQFKDIPHLMCPVVTEMSKAAAILEWATHKMDERYELLAEAGCRDIASYNGLSWEELKERFRPQNEAEEAKIPRKLPYMVFIIDELADLMMTAKEVESHIIRIAQKARAVGIHLILATQRPQANVVTGLIKSNMPCRVSFKVASGMDSRIVLDHKGGELLLGHGDMLFLSPRSNKLTRAQGTLVDDLEIRRVVRFMRDIATPSFERQLVALRSAPDESGTGLGGLTDEERAMASANNSSASLAAAQEDPLFPRAVEIVLETRRGSVSLLQRRLAIGYTRASRLIDLMGIAGIISDHKGSVARDVLITPADWEAMKKLASAQGLASGEKQGDLFNTSATASTPAGGDAVNEADDTEEAPFDDGPPEVEDTVEDEDEFPDAFVEDEDKDTPSRR